MLIFPMLFLRHLYSLDVESIEHKFDGYKTEHLNLANY